MFNIFQIIGALGLLLISAGVLRKKRTFQDELYILGGICLEVYSIYIGDLLFMALQAIFVLAALTDFLKAKKNI